MLEKYKDPLIALIKEKGPLGVNTIAKELGFAPSTMQNYLNKQHYFRINAYRKWDLPENVSAETKSNTLELMAEVAENSLLLLKSQIEEVLNNANNVITPIESLKRAVSRIAPVADSPVISEYKEDKALQQLETNIKQLEKVIAKYINKVPSEYKELIKNLDISKMVIEQGTLTLNQGFNPDITGLFLEKTDELPEETVELLKNYQKQA